ncbi:MAG: response regulator transcription factor [Ferrovum sp.]|nr:response regulator transcription factor [Ferrovum sp.]NDU87187.1 response regulator transcription factor [Ferrovum sp.]
MGDFTILCIEDDRDMASLIAEELCDRGFDVSLAHDGQSGINAILRERPHLVLCDIGLPILDGFEVLDRLSSYPERPPFVFLTALTDRDSELRGRRLGADDYVTKPIDFDVLFEILMTRLGRSPVPALPTIPTVELADREREVLTWSARGKTSSEIAMILGLSKRTVDFHSDNARTKLQVATRIEAAIKATHLKLIEP